MDDHKKTICCLLQLVGRARKFSHRPSSFPPFFVRFSLSYCYHRHSRSPAAPTGNLSTGRRSDRITGKVAEATAARIVTIVPLFFFHLFALLCLFSFRFFSFFLKERKCRLWGTKVYYCCFCMCSLYTTSSRGREIVFSSRLFVNRDFSEWIIYCLMSRFLFLFPLTTIMLQRHCWSSQLETCI